MNAIGIIAEYNPFHNGHAYQLQQLRKQYPTSPLVVVMSGAFVQRGEPALFPKELRAQWALENGADLVIELPSWYAVSNAEQFAAGAMRLFANLQVTTCSFGTEINDLAALKTIAQLLLTPHFQTHMRLFQKEGLSYPSAMQKACHQVAPTIASILMQPNALLGIEYIKASLKYQLPMCFIPIQRHSTHYQEELTALPSGSYLRSQLINPLLPTSTLQKVIGAATPSSMQSSLLDALHKGQYCDYTRYEDYILASSRLIAPSLLKQYQDFSEGLENRWSRVAKANSWPAMKEQLKTKRYTYSRLQRMAAHLVLQRTKRDAKQVYKSGPTYARVLGFSMLGQKWLKESHPTIPYVLKWGKFYRAMLKESASSQPTATAILLESDRKATELQAYCFAEKIYRTGDRDFHLSPLRYSAR